MKIHLLILRLAALLVPGPQRVEWFAEWNAEARYISHTRQQKVTPFCLGAFHDAHWLRRNDPLKSGSRLRLESPKRCLQFLTLVLATCVVLAVRYHPPDISLMPIRETLVAMLCMPLMALPGLMATSSLRLGDYRAGRYGWRWAFFVTKTVLVSATVFSGGLALWPILHSGIGICMVTSCAAALRWTLNDQRLRCPECLRLLGHATRIGQPSHVLLEWYGRELVCDKGHGLLHVSETPTTSFPVQRWMPLDQSWSVWFSQGHR